MASKFFISLKMFLVTIIVFISSLSAYTLQIPESAVRYAPGIEPVHVVHDDHLGWSIIDNDDCDLLVETGHVDEAIRFIDNEDLEKVLGYGQYELSCIDLETHEEVSKWFVQINGYLYINRYNDGAYDISIHMRGIGGGPIAGMIIGSVIKCVGYGVIATCGGPVGWGVAAAGIANTVANGALGFGLGKIAKVASKSKDAVKMAKQLKETEKAVRHYNEAAKAFQHAQSIYDKAKTVKNLKKLKDATATCQKLKQVVDAKSMATAAIATAKAGNTALTAKAAVENGYNTGQVANVAVNGGMAAAFPPIAIVNLAGDIGQFIGDFLPCF